MNRKAVDTDSRITPEFVDRLLSLPTRKEQTEFLRDEGLLNEEGLNWLLDVADEMVGSDPGKARRLAELCAELSVLADAPAIEPRAAYIRAHTHAEDGEFDVALRLVNLAHKRYAALGEQIEALRTNVGLMAVLLDSGRYQEALDAGHVVLSTLNKTDGLEVTLKPRETNLLAALVYQNRGICCEYMGRYEEALSAYSAAEDLYQALGMTERIGEVIMNRGAILLYLGRSGEGLMAQKAASAIFKRAALTALHTKALVNIGEAYLHLGDYIHSLDAFEKARRLLGSLDTLADKSLLLRHTADAYLELNLRSEALAAYGEAGDLLRDAGMIHDLAQTLWGMGSALIARSKFEEAERVLSEAADLFTRAGNVPLRSGVMLEQASLMEVRGDLDKALATAFRALDLVSGDEWPVHRAYAHMRLADLLLPNVSEAEPHLMETQRLIEELTLPHLRYRLHQRLGRARLLQGREEEARELLERAIAEIEDSRNTVAQGAMRASFLRDKTDAYEDLLRLHLARDDAESTQRAFAVAEQAKSRALVDLLAGMGKEPVASGDDEIEGRIRSLQADLNAIYNRLLGSEDDGESRVPLSELQARAAGLEQEISRLRLQAAVAAEVRDPFADPSSLGDLREQIPPGVTLLAYHAIGDEVVAFMVTQNHIEAVRNVGSVEKLEQLLPRLTAQWDRFRAGEEFVRRNMRTLERSARRILAALYGELIEPLETLLHEAQDTPFGEEETFRKLVVVPHGPLHQVPFQALFDGERYLLERFEISYAPSARIFTLCQNKATRSTESVLVMSVSDPSIPAVAKEARAVARRFPDTGLRGDEGATLEALKSGAPDRDVLHLACHGMFRSDNPMFSALKLHDGWLMATDVMRLDLEGALVTLSACESGRNEVIGGDEVLGLTRAFLGAGAATLVVSLWLVQDETTAELMARWYGRLRGGMTRAAALRAAQLEIKEQHPHPYYWAPFFLIGKR